MKYTFMSVVAICLSTFTLAHPNNLNAVEQAKVKLAVVTSHMNDRMKECNSLEQRLKVKNLKAMGIKKTQLKTIVDYFYFKAQLECTRVQEQEYIYSLIVLNQVQKNTSNTEVENYSNLIELVSMQWAKLHLVETEYETLPEKIKIQVANLKELQSPFDGMQAFEDLGL